MSQQGHSPLSWGFGISCGVVLVALLVFILLFLLSLAICGGGIGGIVSLFYVNPEQSNSEPQAATPAVPENPPTIEPIRPKMRVESTNKEVDPQEVRVLIWSESPSEEDYRWALGRLAGDSDRKVHFYESGAGVESEPLAVWLIRDYQYERIE